MISSILYSVLTAVIFIVDIIKFCYKLTNTNCSWFLLLSIFLLVSLLLRYFRLKQPPPNTINIIFGDDGTNERNRDSGIHSIEWWPIANRAACLDALENSKSGIEKCVSQQCKNILLDVEITKCGQLVILHKQTLKRIEQNLTNNSCSDVKSVDFDYLKTLNIAKNHPLCDKYSPESMLQFEDLMQLLRVYESINIFLLVAPTNKMVSKIISKHLTNDSNQLKHVIVCSRSPFVIYRLRKQNPDLICALWLDKTADLKLPNILLNSPLFSFAYGVLCRNIIACVTGISAVFINKHDFNAHIGQMWRCAGIRPIVYTLNSPSEKRYFQQTLKTQYLTDSLRSEPHHFTKIKNCN